MTDFSAIEAAIKRHDRIAFQFSGGRDSLAALYLLRPYWSKIAVYWCNPGDPFPETTDLMELVRAEVPRFVEIAGRQPQVIEQLGIPSDIVPATRTQLGVMVEGKPAPLIQDRYSCCAMSMMVPTHERMIQDGITLIIRGQKNADKFKSPARSGALIDGFEMLFPIEDWTASDVMDYLRVNRLPIPRFYSMLNAMPDCMTCSAWWEEGVTKYLKAYHPEAHAEVQRRLDSINEAVREHIAAFNTEVE